MQSKGVPEHEIEEKIKRMKQVHKMDLSMITPSGKDKGNKPICWSANNPDEYSFTLVRRGAKADGVKQEVDVRAEEESKITVARYFHTRYGITLQYPHLPIVCTKDGYFPVELLMQAKEKVCGENDQDKIDAVLRFNDEFSAAGRIKHIKDVLGIPLSKEYMPGLTFTDVLGRFGISVVLEPETLKADVLKEPQLDFGNQRKCQIQNGSWSLNGVKFPR
jgi:hypothetical protein